MPIDPLRLTDNVRRSYERYLTSSFRLRDARLRELFRKEVSRFWFTNGPILEATPPFKKGCYLKNLAHEGLLNPKMEAFIYQALPYLRDNPLYSHQEKALRKILPGRNVVIGSGTSSGKTECFLIPIYHYLLRQYERGELGPGVRALLLYPMNALANDQLRRLRDIARIMENAMPEVRVTFGRYVGDTPHTKKEGEEKFRHTNPGIEPVKSELLSREEMRETPPHILITNYAMLEYLLLRPKDSPFFDGEDAKHWRFLVLDEAHIYNGATGIEMAMLIRRLKDRVCRNMKGALQCIATSATLVKEEKDLGKVAEFARNLFGEEFEWEAEDISRQDVIYGERIEIQIDPSSVSYQPGLYSALDEIVVGRGDGLELERCHEACKAHGVSDSVVDSIRDKSNGDARAFVYQILSKDRRVVKLKSLLQDGAKSVEECVQQLVGASVSLKDEDRQYAISLLNIAAWSRPAAESAPLLPARYHLFVRAPEGIFVSFYPKERIFLERKEYTEDRHPVFELASCRRCGQEYLIGEVSGGRLRHTAAEVDTPRKNRYFLLWKQRTQLEEDEDQEVAVPEQLAEKGTVWQLCTKCGAIAKERPECACEHEGGAIRTLVEITPKDSVLNQCYLCGLRSVNIVRKFVFQRDAPAAVLVTALYQNLETENIKSRKILSFSDSRQDAAFFAPYLEFTYDRILFRRLVMEAIERNKPLTDYRLRSLCEDMLKLADATGVLDPSMDRKEKKREVWKWLLQDFCGTWDRRNSLEGVGLVSFTPLVPEDWKPIEELQEPPWNLTREEAVEVYRALLNTLRFNNAISFPEDGPSPQDEFFAPRNREYRVRGEGSDRRKGVYSFIPAPGRLNSRLEYLKKLYERTTGKIDEAACRQVLGRIWEDLRSKWVGNGFQRFSDRSLGVLYQLDHRFWQLVVEGEESRWFICDRCGVIVPASVQGVCPTFSCNGALRPFSSEDRAEILGNHYRHLYTMLTPRRMVCCEHTAQLSTDYATSVQERFIRGDISVLSCSTTFELGVDLGELETIFMRNVPPEPSNYIQRAGRAGRRLGTIGFTLTFAQLRSHDLTYFKEPEKMVEGRIKPPVVEIRNEKIVRRHLHSIVFASFFRKFPDCFGSAESFFRLEGNGVSGSVKIKEYLAKKPSFILKSLKRAIPPSMHSTFQPDKWGWENALTGADGALTIADEKIRDEFALLVDFYQAKEQEWKSTKDQRKRNRLNADMDWANRRIETVKKRRLIDFLASHAVIPKYGFPVDVVGLAVLRQTFASRNIQLERDLRIAISEFAPSSQVVANGYIWESSGLRVVKDRTWPIFWYAVCPECGRFHLKEGTVEEAPPSISCRIHGDIGRSKTHRFITPIFGFVTERESEPRKPEESRPKREFSTRPYFFDYKEPEEKEFKVGTFRIRCSYSTDGQLAVVCKGKRGQGFWVCFACGRAFSDRPKKPRHTSPFGTGCSGTINGRLHLGHSFKTDTLALSFAEPTISHRDNNFWFSLLYAILEGASEALGIRRRDLDGCLYPSEEGTMLILFDNVPGGAGHVKRIMQEGNLQDVLEVAWARVKKCTCGPETSCYGCLRNYENQFCHEQLRRGVIADFLERNLTNTKSP